MEPEEGAAVLEPVAATVVVMLAVTELVVAAVTAVAMVTVLLPARATATAGKATSSAMVAGRRYQRPAVTIVPVPRPDASRPRCLEGLIRAVV